MISELCNSMVYCLSNEIQEKLKTPMPYYMEQSLILVNIAIRSYLNTASINRLGITEEILKKIIRSIKMKYIKSLISYGSTIGIIAAQCISEPLTQMILNSKHASASSSTKRQGLQRFDEIISET